MSSRFSRLPSCVDLLVDRHVREGRGDHIALVERSPKQGRRSLSYESLMQLSLKAVRYLDDLMCRQESGQRLALVGAATLENMVFWLGGMRSGRIVFLVGSGLPESYYSAFWNDFDPALVLADRTALLSDAMPMPTIEGLDALYSDFSGGTSEGSSDAGELSGGFPRGDSPALVLATSGSTGKPRLCLHRHASFYDFERTVTRRLWGLRHDDRVLASGGPHFSFGLQGVHVPLSIGACAVLVPVRDRHEDLLEIIEEERVSAFFAVPTLYSILMARAKRHYDTSNLRLSFSAGERLPDVLRERWEKWSGSRMLDSIGTTETFSPYLSEVVDAGAGLRRVSGFIYEVDAVGSSEEGIDQLYSITLSGGCLMQGYLQDRKLIASCASSGFRTHDMFVCKDDVFYFVARDGDRVKVSGQWVCPQDLESFLMNDPRVLKVLVCPVQTDDGLLRLRAHVVPSSLEVLNDRAEWLAHELMVGIREVVWPRALWPDRIDIVADLGSTSSGKLLRRQQLCSNPSPRGVSPAPAPHAVVGPGCR